MRIAHRFWRVAMLAVRLDMAAGIILAAGLSVWLTWH